MITRRELLWKSAALATTGALAHAASTLEVSPATTRTRALAEFERLQFGVSYHFSMNTFTGNDYETGGVPASTYDPTHLDVHQWLQVAHDLGAKYAVLTAKHMSGFCLWDAKDYDYDVAASRNKTDVVAAFVEACHYFKIRPGFYYCILDPHNEGKFDWDIPVQDNYYAIIKRQLIELHSQYRNTFYQLLDITWKLSQEQRWELYRLIKKYSPHCIVVMNQAYYQSKRNLGKICEPKSWPTDVINSEDQLPPPEGHDPHITFEGKTYYMPMEAWMPIGPPYKPMPPMNSWFWREGFEAPSPKTIAAMYRDCIQRKSNLLLNLSPDTSGRIPDQTITTMKEVKRLIR